MLDRGDADDIAANALTLGATICMAEAAGDAKRDTTLTQFKAFPAKGVATRTEVGARTGRAADRGILKSGFVMLK